MLLLLICCYMYDFRFYEFRDVCLGYILLFFFSSKQILFLILSKYILEPKMHDEKPLVKIEPR